mgnify:CR=1 FL=1
MSFWEFLFYQLLDVISLALLGRGMSFFGQCIYMFVCLDPCINIACRFVYVYMCSLSVCERVHLFHVGFFLCICMCAPTCRSMYHCVTLCF